MSQPLRINWILRGTNLAGGTKSNRLLAEAMVRRGHDVTIVYSMIGPTRPRPWQVRCWYRRVRKQFSGLGKQRHHLESSTACLLPVKRCPIDQEDVPDADVTIATWWETAHWIRDWSDRKGLKAYFVRGYEIHGGDPEQVKATYRLPYMKLVISSWLKRLMAEEFDDPNAILIYNGIDHEQFNCESRNKSSVSTVGMLYGSESLKCAQVGFDAFRLLQRDIPQLRVLSFGDKYPLRQHKPPPNFRMHVRPAQSEIPDIYRQADCWLVPSLREGFSMPGLEAAACGCPVVATRCGGPEDYVIEGETGLLVPVNDVEAIAAACKRILELDETDWSRMSKACVRIAKRFDWDKSAELLEKTFYRALNISDK